MLPSCSFRPQLLSAGMPCVCGVLLGNALLNVPGLFGRLFGRSRGGLCERLEVSDSSGRGVGLREEDKGESAGLD